MIRTATLITPMHRLRPLAYLAQWHSLSRQRRALSQLDETALRDLGLTRQQAQQEAARPFWDAPDNWRL